MPVRPTPPQTRPQTRPDRLHPARRIVARACLFACIAALVITPARLQTPGIDAAIRAEGAHQDGQRQRLVASGVSQEALDLHRDTAQARLDGLRVRRRIDLYARAAVHFGVVLALLLGWRALRQGAGHGGRGAAASTGSSASHSV